MKNIFEAIKYDKGLVKQICVLAGTIGGNCIDMRQEVLSRMVARCALNDIYKLPKGEKVNWYSFMQYFGQFLPSISEACSVVRYLLATQGCPRLAIKYQPLFTGLAPRELSPRKTVHSIVMVQLKKQHHETIFDNLISSCQYQQSSCLLFGQFLNSVENVILSDESSEMCLVYK